MSAIFGLFNLDGNPVQPERIDEMRKVMSSWGPDGTEVRISGCAALGHAHLCATPEGRNERMPYANRQSGILVVAAARLDNRDELCDLFHVPLSERPVFSDGRLVSLAFEHFREDAPSHLFGDWSFAAWDEKHRRLFVARDHLGNTGIFYWHKPPVFAFASSPKAILALPEFHARLDEWQLVRYLAIFPGEENEWDRTFWEDIRLLLPSHSLTVTTKAMQLTKYWSLGNAPSLHFSSDEDYLEGFRHHFRRAVQARLRSDRPVGTTLSAGLDSGSVTALAAEELQTTGQTLPAFTSVPLYPAEHLVHGSLADEWPLAHTVAQKYANIEHIPIRAEATSPLTAVHESLDLFGHPLHAAANLYWLQALHAEAERRGLGVLLTGQLGNGGVSWSGGSSRIFFLMVQGRWNEGMCALRASREKLGRSWCRTIRRHLLSPLLGPLWNKRRHFFHPTELPWEQYSAIHPDFAKRIGMRKAMKAANPEPVFAMPRPPACERQRIIELNSPLCYIHHHLGAFFKMDVRDPTADVRLLMFCFGIPEDEYVRDGGERMVARRATAGILPAEARWNTVRGKQAADVGLRLLDHKDEIEEELRTLETRESVKTYLDVSALRRNWRKLQTAVTPHSNYQAASLLLRSIMAGNFIMDITN